MKLHTDGVTISILILIFMILICHTMNYLYPRKRIPQTNKLNNKLNNLINNTKNNKNSINSINTFINTSNDIDYNKIYYHNQNEKQLCDEHAKLPCKKTCSDDDYSLSDSELAFLYKFAYEEAGREILMRTIRGEDGFEY